MYLLPKPRSLYREEGIFTITPDIRIVLDAVCNFNDFLSAQLLQEEIRKKTGFKLAISKSFEREKNGIYLSKKKGRDESYQLIVNSTGIEIEAGDDAGLFYGIQTLRQLIRTEGVNLPCLKINDYPYFSNRGFYHDITRGKVPTLNTLKKLVDRAAFYKINQLQLYIEHTFAFKKHSEVWTGTDPLTAEEILSLDQYCLKRHIELVPSLSTFGHLYHALSSYSYQHLCELEDSVEQPFAWTSRMSHHTLDVSNAESIDFIKTMLSEFIPLFSSDKFNICGDETFDLGEGKNKKLAKKNGKGRLYVDFLNKIIAEVKKYKKKVMFWGDVILKHPDLLEEIPDDVICLNWDYGANPAEAKAKTIAESDRSQYVCPGVSGWNRLMNDMDTAFANIKKMTSYGKKYNALGVLNTNWGDYGHINSLANSMPGMIYGASLSWNPEDDTELSIVDKKISQIEFEDSSGDLVGLLRELSRQQVITWGLLVCWKEEKYDESELNNSSLKEGLIKKTEKEIIDKYQRTLEIRKKLLELSTSIPQNHHQDMQEFYVSASGIALLNSLALVIKKYDFGEEKIALIHEPWELAQSLEYWLVDFSKLWRNRNKESELYRIRETIIKICSYLRCLGN